MKRFYAEFHKCTGWLRRKFLGRSIALSFLAVTASGILFGLSPTREVMAQAITPSVRAIGPQTQIITVAAPVPTLTSVPNATETLSISAETLVPTVSASLTATQMAPTIVATSFTPTTATGPTGVVPPAVVTATPSPIPTPTPSATERPTATRTRRPTPTATETSTAKPISAQSGAGAVTPPRESPSRGPGDNLRIFGGLLLLGVAGLGVAWFFFRRGKLLPKAGLSRPRPSEPGPARPKPSAIPSEPSPAGPKPSELGPVIPPVEKSGRLTQVRPAPGVPYLESRSRPQQVLYCPLEKPAITVGRDAANDLVIDTSFQGWQTVSRRHAVIERHEQRVIVSDQGSRNGVYVNNRRAGTNILRDGWLVRFGEVEFIFRSNQEGGVL